MDEVEAPGSRLKRLRMRSMRRGIRELDLILAAFAGTELDGMGDDEIRTYDRLLDENDQDIYAWITGQTAVPAQFADLVARIVLALQRN